MKILEYKDRRKEHRIKMTADNNKTVDATSEGYHNLQDARDNRVMVSIAYLQKYKPEALMTRETLVRFCDLLEENGRPIDYSLIDEFLNNPE